MLDERVSKPAAADHPIHPLLAERWSPRAFSSRPVPASTLRSILEAARWAPSADNLQPWQFLVATRERPEEHERLLAVLMDGNRRWAWQAPVLMLVVARLYEAYRGHPGYRSLYEVGLAVGALLVQATAHGLMAHQMGGFHLDRARDELGIPEGYAPVAAVALGFPGDPWTLPADLRARELAPRVRRPQEDFVFGARWGTPPVSLIGDPIGEAP